MDLYANINPLLTVIAKGNEMNFFSRFDNSEKPVVNFKPDVKNTQYQPQNVVRTVSQPAPVVAPQNTVKESNMSTYADLKKQIAELTAKADKARQEELSGIISQIKSQIQEYKLSASDLGFSGVKKGKAKTENVIMYRTPDGDTWIGPGHKGKKPDWINKVIEAHGQDGYLTYLEQFKVAE